MKFRTKAGRKLGSYSSNVTCLALLASSNDNNVISLSYVHLNLLHVVVLVHWELLPFLTVPDQSCLHRKRRSQTLKKNSQFYVVRPCRRGRTEGAGGRQRVNVVPWKVEFRRSVPRPTDAIDELRIVESVSSRN